MGYLAPGLPDVSEAFATENVSTLIEADSLASLPDNVVQGILLLQKNIQKAISGEPVAIDDRQLFAVRYVLANMGKKPGERNIPKTILAIPGHPEGHAQVFNGHERLAVPREGRLDLLNGRGEIVKSYSRDPNLQMPSERPINSPARYVDTPSQLEESIKEQLEIAQLSSEPVLHVIAGPSGAGKSSFLSKFTDVANRIGVSVQSLGCDESIATERGELRAIKDRLTEALSHELYTVQEQTVLMLLFALLSGEKAIDISANRIYQRQPKRTYIGPKTFHFSPMTSDTQFAIEGSDALIVADHLKKIYRVVTGKELKLCIWGILPPSDTEIFTNIDLANAGINSAVSRGRGEVTMVKNPWTLEYIQWMLKVSVLGYQKSTVLVDAKSYGPQNNIFM